MLGPDISLAREAAYAGSAPLAHGAHHDDDSEVKRGLSSSRFFALVAGCQGEVPSLDEGDGRLVLNKA